MAKKTKKQELTEFQSHLAKLVEDYGIVGPQVVPSQIIDLAEDLSGESLSNVYALVQPVCAEIQKLYESMGSKPNVVVDSKIKNAMKSFGGVSPEFGVFFLRTVCSVNQVKIKDVAIAAEYRELILTHC